MCGTRSGIAVSGEGSERRVFRMQDVVPSRRGRGSMGGVVRGLSVAKSGSGLEAVLARWVEMVGN